MARKSMFPCSYFLQTFFSKTGSPIVLYPLFCHPWQEMPMKGLNNVSACEDTKKNHMASLHFGWHYSIRGLLFFLIQDIGIMDCDRTTFLQTNKAQLQIILWFKKIQICSNGFSKLLLFFLGVSFSINVTSKPLICSSTWKHFSQFLRIQQQKSLWQNTTIVTQSPEIWAVC